MKTKLIEHLLSILLVGCIFLLFIVVVKRGEEEHTSARRLTIEPYLHIDSLDFGNPLHVALFKETLTLFHPDSPARNDSLLRSIEAYRQELFTNRAYKTGGEERGISAAKLAALGTMYIQFIIVYVIVMVLSYRAAQSLAIFRFVKLKQHKSSYLAELHALLNGPKQGWFSVLANSAVLLAKAGLKGLSYAILFAPAYVIAYSIRSGIDTDSYLFMILLGVISNGLLINYANKFFTFLVAEDRKGYVQTAIVKNLSTSYTWSTSDGVSYRALLQPKGLFGSHVFKHIYLNARHQFLTTLKEHASFLITGLIIIEMALNIQGHLGYEMLQNILYRQYDVVVSIILGIFLLVKSTDIAVDAWFHWESRKYENKG